MILDETKITTDGYVRTGKCVIMRENAIVAVDVLTMVSSLDVQRLFLQSAISRRVLSADLAIVIWKQCVEAVKGLLCLIPPRPHSEAT
jgi:hypothetical protein